MKMKKCNKVIHAMTLLLAVVMFVPIIIGQTEVTAQAKTLKLSDKKLELMPDEFYELKVENAGSKKVTWKSSDKKVISVTAKGNLVVEKARNYTDKQWKNRLKKLGYKLKTVPTIYGGDLHYIRKKSGTNEHIFRSVTPYFSYRKIRKFAID